MRRTVAAIVCPLLLALSACGGGGDGDSAGSAGKARVATLDDVTVAEGSTDDKPEVDFKAPIRFEETESTVVEEGPGTGDAVDATSTVTVDYLGVNASDGTEFDSSWDAGQPATFAVSQVIKGFAMGLDGAHAGDRVLIGVASKDGYDPTGNGAGISKGDSIVLVVDVRKVSNPLAEATGKAAPAPATIPKLTYDKAGHPQRFTATSRTSKSVDKLGIHPIIIGSGPEVQTGQTITVEYVGQVYPDGKVFDESWSETDPVSFPIGTGGVIPGWDRGLVGQKVGSRVILTIPPDLGYGKQGDGSDIPPNADLVFVIDILQAT